MRVSYRVRKHWASYARAWLAIVLPFVVMLLGMIGPALAIDAFYYTPLCQRSAAAREATYWSYESSGRKNPKR